MRRLKRPSGFFIENDGDTFSASKYSRAPDRLLAEGIEKKCKRGYKSGSRF
jgi:hypothetical protein